MIKFKKNGLKYSFLQKLKMGEQWQCDYPDGEFSWAVVYTPNPEEQDVIDAIDFVNGNDE